MDKYHFQKPGIMDGKESRKEFLKRCTYLFPSIFSIALFNKACNTKGDNTAAKIEKGIVSCDDLSGVSKVELLKREQFNYVEVSAVKNKSCKNCNLFIPSKSNAVCGSCMLFKGPVRPGGHCTYWAAIVNNSET